MVPLWVPLSLLGFFAILAASDGRGRSFTGCYGSTAFRPIAPRGCGEAFSGKKKPRPEPGLCESKSWSRVS